MISREWRASWVLSGVLNSVQPNKRLKLPSAEGEPLRLCPLRLIYGTRAAFLAPPTVALAA